MNRQERRFAEKKASSKTTAPANILKADSAKAHGLSLKAAGREAEAIPFFIEALKLNPSLADVHFLIAVMARKPDLKIDMGVVNRLVKDRIALKAAYKSIQDILRQRKQRAENLICQEEICRLFPDDGDEKAEYAIMLNLAERRTEALKIMTGLVNSQPENKTYKGIFVGLLDHVTIEKFEPDIKKALGKGFENIYEINLYRAFRLWLSLIILDPLYTGLHGMDLQKTEEDFDKWMHKASPEQLFFMNDPFFINGLRLLVISDIIIENILVRARKWICLNIETIQQDGRINIFENFIYAMGEQSFFNEYLYPQSESEKNVIDDLIEKIKNGCLKDIKPPYAYGLISSYQPLHIVFPDKKSELEILADQSAGFTKLVKTQFLDIEEESAIKPLLPSFGMLENEISKNVQAQYEENPYPRWVSCVKYPSHNNPIPFGEQYRRNPWKILVAGCGTGRHALSTAATYPNAHVTAIDLSRASLAYAQRKANESGLAERIKFIHADILSMDQWPDQFDIIESSGVLHHMEDPMKGWQILCDRLKPGGYFKVGLYSEAARREIVNARDYIKTAGFESTVEGIRNCREALKQRPSSDSLRQWITNSNDFYNTSSLRDLIFHVQEHRMTLPQIQKMIDQLGLVCIKFILTSVDTANKFDSRFPDDPDRKSLTNWHLFEQDNPDTFAGMYQFWCQKAHN